MSRLRCSRDGCDWLRFVILPSSNCFSFDQKWAMRSAKTHISLELCQVWSHAKILFAQCAFNDLSILSGQCILIRLHFIGYINIVHRNEPQHEKTNVLHMRKQRRRSASR